MICIVHLKIRFLLLIQPSSPNVEKGKVKKEGVLTLHARESGVTLTL